jgi:hypothetical protein
MNADKTIQGREQTAEAGYLQLKAQGRSLADVWFSDLSAFICDYRRFQTVF